MADVVPIQQNLLLVSTQSSQEYSQLGLFLETPMLTQVLARLDPTQIL